jgi:hypothetical protein
MSDTIILHHDNPSHAAAVARGTGITNPADLLPGDVLLSHWAPGRYLTVTAPGRTFCGYVVVEYQTEDGKSGTLNVRADVNPFARRPALPASCDGPVGNPWPKTPTMTRAQFDYLARILCEAYREESIEGPMTVERMVGKFAYHLADTNARFDSERFIASAIR